MTNMITPMTAHGRNKQRRWSQDGKQVVLNLWINMWWRLLLLRLKPIPTQKLLLIQKVKPRLSLNSWQGLNL
jgi:hypothetical protein